MARRLALLALGRLSGLPARPGTLLPLNKLTTRPWNGPGDSDDRRPPQPRQSALTGAKPGYHDNSR
jgi:hypothetical protein